MKQEQFLRIKKLTGKTIIEVAARHNHREILAELGAAQGGRIDLSRVPLNRVLRGCDTAAAVARQAKMLMEAAGATRLRKDAVRALEIVFSLPPKSSINHELFFIESVQWVEQHFAAPVISAIVHNDEAAPHCHVLLLPLVDGRMVGSDLMGGPAKLKARQADFHANVGQRHGLVRQTAQKHPSVAIRRQAINWAFDALEANSGLSVDVLLALLTPHLDNPAPLLTTLGLTMPTSTAAKGGFVAMMTKPCKQEKPIGFGKKKPIGFDGSAVTEKGQTLSCVGFAKSSPSFPAANEPQQATQVQSPAPAIGIIDSASIRCEEVEQCTITSAINLLMRASVAKAADPQPTETESDYTREREHEQPAEQWCSDLGDFIKPAVKVSCKPAVLAAVLVALESKGRHGGLSKVARSDAIIRVAARESNY